MTHFFMRFIKEQKGASAVEFALVCLFFVVCIPTLIDVAGLIKTNMKLTGGIRAGEQYALKNPTDNTGIATAISSASDLPSSAMSVTSNQFCECSGLTSSCSTTCSGGITRAKYVSITANYDMSNQYNYGGMLFPQTVSKSITVRVQ